MNKTVLAVLLLCMSMLFMSPTAFADEGSASPSGTRALDVNFGNPFENGDFDRTHRYGEFGWQVSGLVAVTDGCYGCTSASPPFEYPSQIMQFANALKASGGSTALGEWGPVNFKLRNVRITENPRNIVLKSALPQIAHCCQHDNAIPADIRKPITFLVEETKSYWEGDGIYHACLVALVGNTIVHGEWDQALIGINYLYADWYVYGGIEMRKVSGWRAFTDGNANYSLEGAKYGVFETEEAAKSHDASKAFKTYSTDSHGCFTTEQDFTPGTWYVSEIEPSAGYALDESVHQVEVKAGQIAKVDGSGIVEEMPLSNPTTLLLAKRDAATGKASPQGSARLSNAEFKVCYYDGYFNANNLPESPKRSWMVKSDDNGLVDMANSSSIISGTELYRNKSNNISWPLGTIAITETKPPVGYLLDGADNGKPKTYVMHVKGQAKEGTAITPVNFEQPLTELNTPVLPETVKRGDFRLVKEAPIELADDDPQRQKRVLVQGIQFQIINSSANAVVSPQDGKTLVAPGKVVCTIATDENGLASTRSAAANGWEKPKSWSGALAYGTYTVHEVIPSQVARTFEEKYGTKMMTVDDWKVTISDNGSYDAPTVVTNTIPQSPLRIVKRDAETGQRICAQVSYQIFDSKGKLVTYRSRSPKETIIDTFTSNDEGEITLPMLLNAGDYTVKETQAPAGYVLDGQQKKFSVNGQNNWDNPIVIDIENKPVKGKLSIVKTDARDASAIAGAEYTLKAAADIVTPDGTLRMKEGEIAATLVTDENGSATSNELYLGPYLLYETKSPDGWALDTAEYPICLEGAGQENPVAVTRKELSDVPTTLVVQKTDAKTGKPLENAHFHMWQDGSKPTYRYDTASIGKSVETALNSDEVVFSNLEDAIAEIADGKAGDTVSIHARERMGQTWSDVLVNAQLLEDKGINLVLLRAGGNAAQDGSVTIPAEVVINPNALSFDIWTNAEGLGEINRIPKGKYHVTEVSPPKGYYVTGTPEVFEVTVNEQGLIGLEGQPFSDTLTISAVNEPVGINTTFTDDNGAKQVSPKSAVTLVDTVKYRGCVPGTSYTLKGSLHVVAPSNADNLQDAKELLDAQGMPVTAETTFTADAQEGSTAITFTIDASLIAGHSIVAFEKLYEGEELFASHEDIGDAAQTVYVVPEIATTLTDKQTGNHTARCAEDAVLVDTIDYRGLTPGCEYKVLGALMDKQTGEALKTAEGKPIESSATFVAESIDGSLAIEFSFDSSKLESVEVVAFEKLFDVDGQMIAQHEDLSDENQTVVFPKIRTYASCDDEKSKLLFAGKKAKVHDEVHYSGLTVGVQYTLLGTLHIVKEDEDGSRIDGGAVKEEDAEVKAAATFVPEKADGSQSVEFEFDASQLAGSSLVAFEDLFQGDVRIAAHADVNDEDQTISIPSIYTTAADCADGDQVLDPQQIARVNDEVNYCGIAPGESYRVKGKLMYSDSGKPVTSWGKEITAEMDFEAQESKGSVVVPFEFDPADCAGKKVVVFEELYDDKGKLVAEHANLEDEAQTLEVSSLPKGYSKTADVIAKYWPQITISALAIALPFGIAVLSLRKLHKKRR